MLFFLKSEKQRRYDNIAKYARRLQAEGYFMREFEYRGAPKVGRIRKWLIIKSIIIQLKLKNK